MLIISKARMMRMMCILFVVYSPPNIEDYNLANNVEGLGGKRERDIRHSKRANTQRSHSLRRIASALGLEPPRRVFCCLFVCHHPRPFDMLMA
jgi:hypothetical protein